MIIIILKTLTEAEEFYGGKELTISLVNLPQVIFYATYGCQPVWVGGGLDKRFVALYLKKDTLNAWREWRNTTPPNK
jgi:hypothetical protein